MRLKKFENFNYADKVENLIDANTTSKELVNMSSEELSANEFGEYLEDYYNDPKSANIDVNSLYYSAIVSAYEDISNVARSPKWQESDVENSEFYQEYKKNFL